MTGLQKQIVPISFSQGIDTKTDEKQVVPGKFLVLENGVFRTAKETRKRYGFDKITSDVNNDGTLSEGSTISSYKDELVVLDGEKLFSYSVADDILYYKGMLVATEADVSQIVKNTYSQSDPFISINGNYACYVYNTNNSSEPCKYTIIDQITGLEIIGDVSLGSSITNVKVESLGSYFVIIYQDNTGSGPTSSYMYYRTININNISAISTQSTLVTDSNNIAFDTFVSSGKLYFGYVNSSSKFTLAYIDSTFSSPVKLAYSGSLTRTISQVSITADSNNVWFVTGSLDSGTYYVDYIQADSSLNAFTGSYSNAASKSSRIRAISCIIDSSNSSYLRIYFEYGLSGTSATMSTFYNKIDFVKVDISSVIIASSMIYSGLSLTSKAFVVNNTYYMLICNPTYEQPTYFVGNDSGYVIAKYLPGNGGTSRAYGPSKAAVDSSGNYILTASSRDALIAFSDTTDETHSYYTRRGVSSLKLTFSTESVAKSQIANNLYFGGGMQRLYDGSNVVESGFNTYPEGVTTIGIGKIISTAFGPGNITSNVTFFYTVIYQWTDNNGQTHRSAPSTPSKLELPGTSSAPTYASAPVVSISAGSATVTITGTASSIFSLGAIITNTHFPSGTYIKQMSGSTIVMSNLADSSATSGNIDSYDVNNCTVTIPTLKLTDKENVQIIVYRTTANGTVYYRVSDPASPTYNDPLSDYITYTDGTPDSYLRSNEQLYTTGGEVENLAPLSATSMTIYKNRSIYLSNENKNAFFYSKQVIPGFPTEYNEQVFIQNVDSRGGNITVIAEMDDKIIIFKPGLIFYVAGDGPTPSGTNNDFTNVQLITTDTGCNDKRSVVTTPIGLMFKSPKGIYLLGRNLQVQYIGADVESYNSYSISSAILVDNQNQVRYTISNGTSLVYDYYFNQWSVFSGISAIDATQFQDRYTYLTSSGSIYKENESNFTDNGSLIALKWKTGWLSFAGIQGFERAYKLLILGEYKSPHTLNIYISYDFDSTLYAITPIVVSSNPGVYQYRIFLPRQKCESFQITIEETQSEPYGEGLSLSTMLLEVGIKQGPNKLPAARSFG